METGSIETAVLQATSTIFIRDSPNQNNKQIKWTQN